MVWPFGVLNPETTMVIHFTRSTANDSKCVLVEADYDTFKNPDSSYESNPVYDVNVKADEAKSSIIRRAEEELEKFERGSSEAYNLMFNNCETFARYCATGKSPIKHVSLVCCLIF